VDRIPGHLLGLIFFVVYLNIQEHFWWVRGMGQIRKIGRFLGYFMTLIKERSLYTVE